jgi:poly(ribitol-phosphate) beta-N-acetylglucosaminyltransferase
VRALVKVSVIVPVYNPGKHFETCVTSLLGQSMPAGECELIFVDDGSTDGTAARLDALAAEHPHVVVEHIPNSGWPGRPRNLGMQLARGEFVYFVDNDDRLEPEALERLYAAALADEADIVIGKVVGHGKSVPRSVFVANAHDLDASTVPFGLLTPHKLFRRALLEEHGIRFPEGPRRLEDHFMVVPAFFHARRIAILADYPCYHWMTHEGRTNASFQAPEPADYFGSVRDVLGVVDEHTEPGELRDRLYMRWYSGKLLARVAGWMLSDDEGFRQTVLEEGGRLVERFPQRLDSRLSYVHGLRARLLRAGDRTGLERLSGVERAVRAGIRINKVRGDGTWLSLHLTGRLRLAGLGPLEFTHRDGGLAWVPPAPLEGVFGADALDVTGRLRDRGVVVLLKSLADGTEWVVPSEAKVRVPKAADGEPIVPKLKVHARIAPTIAAAGAPLPAGEYHVFMVVSLAGISAVSRVRRRNGEVFTVTATRLHRLEHPRPPRRPKAPPPPVPASVKVRRAALRAAHEVPGLLPALRGAWRRVAS